MGSFPQSKRTREILNIKQHSTQKGILTMSTDERRDKFVKLAEARTNNAIKQIKLIGNLSNRGNYSFTEKDVDKIYNTLQKEIKTMKDRFSNSSNSSKNSFKL